MLLIYEEMREWLGVLKIWEGVGHLSGVVWVGAVIVQQFESCSAVKNINALLLRRGVFVCVLELLLWKLPTCSGQVHKNVERRIQSR